MMDIFPMVLVSSDNKHLAVLVLFGMTTLVFGIATLLSYYGFVKKWNIKITDKYINLGKIYFGPVKLEELNLFAYSGIFAKPATEDLFINWKNIKNK